MLPSCTHLYKYIYGSGYVDNKCSTSRGKLIMFHVEVEQKRINYSSCYGASIQLGINN